MGNLCEGNRKIELASDEIFESIEQKDNIGKLRTKSISSLPNDKNQEPKSVNFAGIYQSRKIEMNIFQQLVNDLGQPIGKLKFVIESAKIHDNLLNFNVKVNPQVMIKFYGMQNQKAIRTQKKNGNNPTWNESFSMIVHENQIPIIEISIMSILNEKDEMELANAAVNIKQLFGKCKFEGKVLLYYRSLRTASLKIKMQYEEDPKPKKLEANYNTFGNGEFFNAEEYPLKNFQQKVTTPKFIHQQIENGATSQTFFNFDFLKAQESDIDQYDRDNIIETIRDVKTPTSILIKMLEIEKAEYIYQICAQLKMVISQQKKQEEIANKALVYLNKYLISYKHNFLIISQIIWIISRLTSLKIDIYDYDLLEGLFMALEYALNEEIVGVILDILKFNMGKEQNYQDKLKKLWNKGILTTFINLNNKFQNSPMILAGVSKIVFDIVTLQVDSYKNDISSSEIVQQLKVKFFCDCTLYLSIYYSLILNESNKFIKIALQLIYYFQQFVTRFFILTSKQDALRKNHFHHELVKNQVKILQYLIASSNKNQKLVQIDDISLIKFINDKYYNDTIICKFVAAILKDLCSDADFFTTNASQMLNIFRGIIKTHKLEKEIINQCLNGVLKISEKNQQIFCKDKKAVDDVIFYLGTWIAQDNFALTTLKILNNLCLSHELISYLKQSQILNKNLDIIIQKMEHKQSLQQNYDPKIKQLIVMVTTEANKLNHIFIDDQ